MQISIEEKLTNVSGLFTNDLARIFSPLTLLTTPLKHLIYKKIVLNATGW